VVLMLAPAAFRAIYGVSGRGCRSSQGFVAGARDSSGIV